MHCLAALLLANKQHFYLVLYTGQQHYSLETSSGITFIVVKVDLVESNKLPFASERLKKSYWNEAFQNIWSKA